MKTLHKYLVIEVLASLLLTVTVCTFVVLLGNVLKEILNLLLSGEVRIGIVLQAIGLLIPFALVFALPIGFITATLLVFGRFSADQELTAARASGISLLSLIMPVLLLSLLCCGLSAWVNMDLGPRSRVAYKELIDEARSDLARIQLPPNTLIRDFPGYIVSVGQNKGGDLEDLKIWKISEEPFYLTAARGRMQMTATNTELDLYLYDAVRVSQNEVDHVGIYSVPLKLDAATNRIYQPKITEMTFRQLEQELRERERLANLLPVNTNSAANWRIQFKETQSLIEQARVEMHRQIAFSFACFGFALVGIPLGIRMHRRETNIGVAIALILVTIYFSFLFLAEGLASRPEFAPHLIFWLPNFIFQAVGAVLLWRANKGVS